MFAGMYGFAPHNFLLLLPLLCITLSIIDEHRLGDKLLNADSCWRRLGAHGLFARAREEGADALLFSS
jgi:hypothetical protein